MALLVIFVLPNIWPEHSERDGIIIMMPAEGAQGLRWPTTADHKQLSTVQLRVTYLCYPNLEHQFIWYLSSSHISRYFNVYSKMACFRGVLFSLFIKEGPSSAVSTRFAGRKNHAAAESLETSNEKGSQIAEVGKTSARVLGEQLPVKEESNEPVNGFTQHKATRWLFLVEIGMVYKMSNSGIHLYW